MNSSRYRPALIIVVGILGFIVAVSFNTTSRLSDARTERANDLADVVQGMERERTDLEDRLADLRASMTDLEEEAAADAGVRETFTRELERVRESAGLAAVVGPGVEIMLGDGSDVAPGSDPNDFLIHDTDISAVVNALLAGGAEAVEVNGERVVATTPVRCAGTTILVNATRLGSPYTIKAIGDPDELEEAVMEDTQASLLFTTYETQYGLAVSITKVPDELEVVAYRGSLRPQYAAPLEGDAS